MLIGKRQKQLILVINNLLKLLKNVVQHHRKMLQYEQQHQLKQLHYIKNIINNIPVLRLDHIEKMK